MVDHQKIKSNHIASIRAIIPNFEKIIKMCQLEPGDTYRDWYDSYGNFLKINDSNIVKLKKGTLYNNSIKDIYAKSNFEFISEFSYWSCFIFANNKTIVYFIGSDGVIRLLLKNDKWEALPSLFFGYDIINKISELYLIDEFIKINNVESFKLKEKIKEVYIIPWPPSDEAKKVLKEYKID